VSHFHAAIRHSEQIDSIPAARNAPQPPANFGVKLSAGWCLARQPSCLLSQPASRRHDGRRSLPSSSSLVAAAVAPLRSSHMKPAAAYTKDVSRMQCRGP